MTDLIRLADDPDVPSELRRALSAEKRKAPPPSLLAAVWGTVAAQLQSATAVAASTQATRDAAATITATSGTSSASAAVLASVGALKAFALGVGLGTVVLGVPTWISDQATERPELSPPALPSARAKTSRLPAGLPGIEAHAPPSLDSSPAPSVTPVPELPGSARMIQSPVASETASAAMLAMAERARTEAGQVRAARACLRSGDSGGALAVLSELDRHVPNGVLAQERAALRIEALFALGRIAEATRAAEEFLAQHSESPHAGRIRALVPRPRSSW